MLSLFLPPAKKRQLSCRFGRKVPFDCSSYCKHRLRRRQANHFFAVLFSIFELGGITKHLMTGPSENGEFCFPSTSMFPTATLRGKLRVSGKQNSLFPLGPVIKCLLSTIDNNGRTRLGNS